MRRIKRGTLKPDQSSLVINLTPILKSRGVKHPTAFLQKLGISPNTVSKLLKGEARQISLKQMTKICVALNCTPSHLYERRDMDLPPNHALLSLQIFHPDKDLPDIEEFLLGKSVEEVREMFRGE